MPLLDRLEVRGINLAGKEIARICLDKQDPRSCHADSIRFIPDSLDHVSKWGEKYSLESLGVSWQNSLQSCCSIYNYVGSCIDGESVAGDRQPSHGLVEQKTAFNGLTARIFLRVQDAFGVLRASWLGEGNKWI